MKALLAFIAEQDGRLIDAGGSSSETERVLARMVKIGEEFGELCDAVLASQGDQRQEKLEAGGGKDELAKEFADVIITTLLLARTMDIDIEQALETKIAKIRARTVAKKAR